MSKKPRPTSRDFLPPCPKCGGARGAHDMGCTVPAVNRTAKTLGGLTRVGAQVLAEAISRQRTDLLVKLGPLVAAELARRARGADGGNDRAAECVEDA